MTGPDRLPDGGRDAADALHRRRARGAAAAAVRGRPARRPPAVGVHRAARGAAAPSRGSASRSSGRARRPRRARWSTSRRAPRCPTRGATPSTTRIPRRPRLLAALDAGRAAARAAAGRHRAARPERAARSRGRWASAPRSAPREEVDLVVVGGGPAGLGAAVYGASEGLEHARRREHRARRPGRRLAADRELPRLPGRHQRHRADDPRRHSGAQVRRAHGDAVPRRRARAGRPTATSCGSRRAARSRRARSSSRPAPSIAGCRSTDLEDYEGISVFYAAGPPEAQRCGATRVAVVGGGNSAAQAAIWLARGGALVTLLHRRADLRETMSDYLIRDLERYGVAVRDRCEIAALHGTDGQLEAVTLRDGEQLAALVPVPLPRRARRAPTGSATPSRATSDGFVLTGAGAGRRRPARDERARRLRRRRRRARARSSAAPRPSARARRSCASCTTGSSTVPA